MTLRRLDMTGSQFTSHKDKHALQSPKMSTVLVGSSTVEGHSRSHAVTPNANSRRTFLRFKPMSWESLCARFSVVLIVLVVMSWVMTTQGYNTNTHKSTPTKSLGCHIHTCSTLISDAKVQIVPGMHLATIH